MLYLECSGPLQGGWVSDAPEELTSGKLGSLLSALAARKDQDLPVMLWRQLQLLTLGKEGNFDSKMEVIKAATGLGAVSAIRPTTCSLYQLSAGCVDQVSMLPTCLLAAV